MRLLAFLCSLFLLTACGSSTSDPGADSQRAALLDSLDQGYARIHHAADSLVDSPRMQSMWTSMQSMHAQMMGEAGMHGSMQGPMHDNDMDENGMHSEGMHGEDHHKGMQDDEMRGDGMMHGEGMHDASPSDTAPTDTTRGTHHRLWSMHATMAQMHREAGREDWAAHHRKMEQWHREMASLSEGTTGDAPAGTASAREAAAASGQSLYEARCATCHLPNGQGVNRAFPALDGSSWVNGDPKRLAKVVLHGLYGRLEMDGQVYNGAMPGFGNQLTDAEIARILTYVRTSWSNDAASVSPDLVRRIRTAHSDRTSPWKVVALTEE